MTTTRTPPTTRTQPGGATGRLLIRLLLTILVFCYYHWLSRPLLLGERGVQLVVSGYAVLQLLVWQQWRGAHGPVTRRLVVWLDLAAALAVTAVDPHASEPMFVLIVLALLNAGVQYGRAVYVELLVGVSALLPAALVYQASLVGAEPGADRVFQLALALVAGFCGYLLVARVGQLRQAAAASEDRDRLTGLLNRRAFLRSAEQMLSLARRAEMPVVLVAVAVNDLEAADRRWGHEVGDRALEHLADIVQRRLRESDLGARLDNERIVLALSAATTVGAELVTSRLEEEFALWSRQGGHELKLGFAMRPLPGDVELQEVLAPLLQDVGRRPDTSAQA